MASEGQFAGMEGTKELSISATAGVLGKSRLVIDDEPEEEACLRRGKMEFEVQDAQVTSCNIRSKREFNPKSRRRLVQLNRDV